MLRPLDNEGELTGQYTHAISEDFSSIRTNYRATYFNAAVVQISERFTITRFGNSRRGDSAA